MLGKRAVAYRESLSVVAGGRGGWATAVCQRWQRDVSERRGEEEGGEEKRRKERRGGKEEEEKKRVRSGKTERTRAKMKGSESSDPRQTGLTPI
ncbi:hypothetical protein CDL15_Pgr023633 [Punica granatum]|uniref:Uncharacterized protein n=1 Tax=Punica granatum TaxID=22663 RepID=A0A218W865_PUNGR|nr:hypothetical protein CDL15_Pgr023633 [Punica granatum]PKI76657.1 hypothetical protein CRG98_002966 [Punica granatum]